MFGQFVDRPVARQLLPAAADRLQRLLQDRLDGPELGLDVGVRLRQQLLRVAAVGTEELGPAAVDRADRLAEHHLEVGQLAVHVVVGLGPDLLGLPAGLRENARRLVLRTLDDLGALDEGAALGVRRFDDPARLLLGVGHDLLAPAQHLPGLGERAGKSLPDLLQAAEQV